MLSSIFSAITQEVQVVDVVILMAIIWQARGQMHLKELFKAKLEPIEKSLNNHVTGTESKIKDLKNELKEDNRELKRESKENFTRLENKIDKLADQLKEQSKDKK